MLAPLLALALALPAPPGCGTHPAPATLLLSPQAAEARMRLPGAVVLAVNLPASDTGHLPGARAFDYHAVEDLTPAQLSALFARLGIGPGTPVVLYSGPGGLGSAARVFVALDSIGAADRAGILDGGLAAWQRSGRPLSRAPAPPPAPLTPRPCAADDVLVDRQQVLAQLHHPGVALVDARLAAQFRGTVRLNQERAGHIPGAVNLPYTELVDAHDQLLPLPQLRARLAAVGIHPGDRILAYCHTGHQASALYFVARLLGLDVRLYAGSWADWSRDPLLPAALGGS